MAVNSTSTTNSTIQYRLTILLNYYNMYSLISSSSNDYQTSSLNSSAAADRAATAAAVSSYHHRNSNTQTQSGGGGSGGGGGGGGGNSDNTNDRRQSSQNKSNNIAMDLLANNSNTKLLSKSNKHAHHQHPVIVIPPQPPPLSQSQILCSNSLSSSSSSPCTMPCVLKYRNLGRTGLRVSQFGLGTWVTFGSQVSDDVAEEILTLAYQSGINIFDTAEVYGAGKAELALGRVLKKKQWRRSSYIVCTKIYWGGKAETERGLSRKHIIEGLSASLERLQLSYVDIVFANKPDTHTPMEEIVRAFTHLINNNMTFYWGTSRWNTMEIMEAYSVARQFNLIPPICEQAEYNLFQREEVECNIPEIHSKIGIGTMTYGALSCGILTGKYDDGIPLHSRASLKGYGWLKEKILNDDGREQQIKIRLLQSIAEKLNCTLAQLSIAWCLKNENVHCILLGASTADQLLENIQSIQIVHKLTPAIVNDIERILNNRPITRQLSKNEHHNHTHQQNNTNNNKNNTS